MSTFKKVLASTAALAGLIALAAPANAEVTGGAATKYVASPTATPAAATSFTNGGSAIGVDNVAVAGFSAGVATALFTPGNTITFTLNQGTFANLPTAASVGGSVSYISGGAGQNFVTYQIAGATTALNLTNVNVAGVTAVTSASTVTATLSDGAGALIAATAKSATIATFVSPYTFTYTAAAPTVDLGATNPGAQYASALVGSVTITPAADALSQWGAVATTAALDAVKGSLALTLPAGPFNGATLGAGCVAAPQAVTTITGGVVTFAGLGSVNNPGGAACTSSLTLTAPVATATSLLATGATSAAATLNLANAPTSTGSTVTSTGALGAITFAGGASTVAGYTVGADAAYDFYVNVANGTTAGPVIVSANAAGSTGTAVLTTSIAANADSIYSIAQIKAALVLAGLPSTIFSSGGDRGQITIVAPTGAKVTPLLLNKANGQVVEVGKEY